MHSNSIHFLLNGEPRSLTDPPATRTVLEYLRIDCGLTGTKEGCAEGDCGACTVIVTEARTGAEAGAADGLVCRAMNSCIQFLPTLDGKSLYTVEALGGQDKLHPVQQAMVEQHGSQCGFCTPGFVMSLFALYKTNPKPTRAEIEDALSGNLCRCTGYRPIVDAAHRMSALGAALPVESLDWIGAPAARSAAAARAGATLRRQIDELRRESALSSMHHGGAFHAPRSIEELAQLRAHLPEARLLAGGTDVGLWVTKQMRDPGDVIYLGEVAGLKDMRVGATHMQIGAAATLAEAGPLLAANFPGMEQVIRRFASPPIRNAATLGGNIANGSPIGDSMPCLMALGASVVLRSRRGARELRLEDFFLAYQKTALQADEFIAIINVPLLSMGDRFRAYKISKRYDQDISIVLAAFHMRTDGGRIADCRIAYGGMAAIPKRAPGCEAALRGAPWSADSLAAAAEKLGGDYSPIDDLRGSAAYRMRVAKNLLARFFAEESAPSPPSSHSPATLWALDMDAL